MNTGDKEVLVEEEEVEAGVVGRTLGWARSNWCLFLVGAMVKLGVIVALVYWRMLPLSSNSDVLAV